MKLPKINKYPKEIIIKDESYRVCFVDVIDGKDTLGQTDSGTQVIHLKKGQTLEETLKTLIHECLHALEFEYDIKISHKAVYQLENAIFDLLIKNF